MSRRQQFQLSRRPGARQVLGGVVPGHRPAAPEAAHQHGAERRAVHRVEGQRAVVRRLHVRREVILRGGGRGWALGLGCGLLAFLFDLWKEEMLGLSFMMSNHYPKGGSMIFLKIFI